MHYEFSKISYKEAKGFLLPLHYSGRTPSISYAFGIHVNGVLSAVCTFGKPASNPLCVGVCGPSMSSQVYELNRLCRLDNFNVPLSKFVGRCLRELKKDNLIVISYSDTAMGHNGYVYQATNFLYTGATKRRTDKYTKGNKHPRHYSNADQGTLRKVRSAKHRYVYFAMDKRSKRKARSLLRYDIFDYPKGDNNTYKLGTYLEPEIIDTTKKDK